MTQSNGWAIGVDLGGTKIEVARVNGDGSIEQKIRLNTDVKGGTYAVLSQIVAAAKDLKKGGAGAPAAIGVAVAGQVDEKRGIVRFAPNLGWRDVSFGRSLSEALDVPAVLMNDVRAATWGEWLHGAGKDCDDLVCVFAGTGIGGGVVSGGNMLTGCANTAGEIGHITIDLDGPACTCGNNGCLESIAGGWAIARSALEAIKKDPSAGKYLLDQSIGDEAGVTTKTVSQAAASGDPLARKLMDDAARALVAGTVSLVNAFNPCRLILGGGVIDGMPELVDRIEQGVRTYALSTATGPLEVIPAQLGLSAGTIGIAACALRTVRAKKTGRSAA